MFQFIINLELCFRMLLLSISLSINLTNRNYLLKKAQPESYIFAYGLENLVDGMSPLVQFINGSLNSNYVNWSRSNSLRKG